MNSAGLQAAQPTSVQTKVPDNDQSDPDDNPSDDDNNAPDDQPQVDFTKLTGKQKKLFELRLKMVCKNQNTTT